MRVRLQVQALPRKLTQHRWTNVIVLVAGHFLAERHLLAAFGQDDARPGRGEPQRHDWVTPAGFGAESASRGFPPWWSSSN